MPNKHEPWQLQQMQSLPLHAKVAMTRQRIREWVDYWNARGEDVHVSFSGGKDSTVLLHIAREMYPDIPAIFCDTGLEYPEIRKFAMSHENITVLRPKMRFPEVIRTYGYPLISKEVAEAIHYARRIGGGYTEMDRTPRRKRIEFGGKKKQTDPDITRSSAEDSSERGDLAQAGMIAQRSQYDKSKYLPIARDLPAPISHYCCNIMKKMPAKKYSRANKSHPIIGTLADESVLRRQAWLRHGCNAFDSADPTSNPMSFWLEQDVLQYILENNIEICSVYGDIVPADGQVSLMDEGPCKMKCSGCPRTGCVYCAFGAHLEKESRFIRLKETHPTMYKYCIEGGQWADNPAYVPDAPEYDGEWKNWNPQKIWVPSQKGLGMGALFDMVNELYGKELIKYK